MTRDPALALGRPRKDRNWPPISETVKKPGDWRQTRDGWEKVPTE